MAVSIIDRTAAEALISEQLSNTIFQDVPKTSTVMQLAHRLPNMTSKQTKVPVLSMLPMAYWVSGDNGKKQTSKAAWEGVTLTAAELAVIVPIPEAVLADASFDIIGEITPRVREAIGAAFDNAVLFGTNKPSEWGNALLTQITAKSQSVTGPITYTSIMGEGGLLAKVEDAGYAVNGVVAAMKARAGLRGLLDTAGRPLYVSDMQGSTPYALDGAPMFFPANGSFEDDKALMFAGDWSQLVYAIRQDVTAKILTEGVIQDPSTGNIVYNLAQQDMVALRVTFRAGWALPNPATAMNSGRTKLPFSAIVPADDDEE